MSEPTLDEIAALNQQERLRALLSRAGASLAELARGIGVHRQTVQWWVTDGDNQRVPSLNNFILLHTFLAERIAGLTLGHVIGHANGET